MDWRLALLFAVLLPFGLWLLSDEPSTYLEPCYCNPFQYDLEI